MKSGDARLFAVTVHTPDVESTAAFYRDVIGMGLHGERHGDGPQHYHGGWDHGLLFTIWPGEAVPQHLGVLVDDLKAVHERAVARGVEVLQAPGRHDEAAPPGWTDCTLRDPMGNAVHVWQEASS